MVDLQRGKAEREARAMKGNQVVAAPRRARTSTAEWRHRHDDRGRVASLKCRRVERAALPLRGGEGVDDDVATRGEIQARVAVDVAIQVEDDAALGRIQIAKQSTALRMWH